MIGKAEWFERRKYLGWGLHPKTWQGYAYIAAFIAPFAAFQALPFWDAPTRIVVTAVWLSVLFFDILHIMATLKKDEMETRIEAISERNAAWAMVAVIVAGILYQSWTSAMTQEPSIDWFLAGALAAGAMAKTLSNVILEKRGV